MLKQWENKNNTEEMHIIIMQKWLKQILNTQTIIQGHCFTTDLQTSVNVHPHRNVTEQDCYQ